jgi:hypothetical protein
VEAITQCDADSKRALADAQELYASADARAGAIIKQQEDLTVRACQINQRARVVEELEGSCRSERGSYRSEKDDC